MTYTDLIDKQHGQVATEEDMDAIRSDIEHLASMLVNGTALSEVAAGTSVKGYDYDSGWFAVAHSNQYAKAHGLASQPTKVIVLHNTASDGSGTTIPFSFTATTTDPGANIQIDGTNITLSFPPNGSNATVFYSTSAAISYRTGGYARILASTS